MADGAADAQEVQDQRRRDFVLLHQRLRDYVRDGIMDHKVYLIYAAYLHYADFGTGSGVFVSLDRIAKDMKLHRDWVRWGLQCMEALGLVCITRRPGRTTLIAFRNPPDWSRQRPLLPPSPSAWHRHSSAGGHPTPRRGRHPTPQAGATPNPAGGGDTQPRGGGDTQPRGGGDTQPRGGGTTKTQVPRPKYQDPSTSGSGPSEATLPASNGAGETAGAPASVAAIREQIWPQFGDRAPVKGAASPGLRMSWGLRPVGAVLAQSIGQGEGPDKSQSDS